jgi:hypothetical protein
LLSARLEPLGVEVLLMVWGDKPNEDNAQWQGGPVLGVKKCKVSDYSGVSLSTLGPFQLIFEPQVRGRQTHFQCAPDWNVCSARRFTRLLLLCPFK